jgi:SAM-dependent MidA family methyltransferase
LTTDYGKRFAGAANAPRTYFKHHTDDRVTDNTGRQDITAPVDFDALISEGRKEGFSLESYKSFGSFLIDNGISDFMPMGGDLASYRERVKVKTLIHPEAMGEAFKVLIQSKGLGKPA